MNSILKNVLTIAFFLGIVLYAWYFRPKQNALKTVLEFKEFNEKHKGNLVYESKPNIIDFSNPWRYGTTETLIYEDPRWDEAIKSFPLLSTLSRIKVFSTCRLNASYKYKFSNCIVLYSKIKDSLYFDEYEIDPKRFPSLDLNDLEVDSLSNLYIKKYNTRFMKVTKTPNGRFDFFLFENNKYESFGYPTTYFEYDCLFKSSSF
jgi:hypothetical protein